jgi:exodeoxyribonuclease VII large subunit
MGSPGDTLELPFEAARNIYTVSALNREVRRLIEDHLGTVWVQGEISNLAQPSSGHLYWSMKDENAQLRCVMFRQNNRLLNFSPENGREVLARGKVSIYETRGEFQLVVEYLEEAGEGLLRRRFEELKKKLAAEGLFEADRKRSLPQLPERIGILTSPSGAAVRDVLTVLARRFPAVPVLVYPTPVQGEGAADQIARTLRLADARQECDLLILTRGGGSLEDLWSFNEEVVARALAAIETPVIVGVGHEIDFTIADFVADVRAPTPSGAAEIAVPNCAEWLSALNVIGSRLTRAVSQRLAAPQRLLESLSHRLNRSHPGIQLNQSSQRLDELERRLRLHLERSLTVPQSRLAELTASLLGATPRHLLTSLRDRLNFCLRDLDHGVHEVIQTRRNRLSLAERALQSVNPLATLDRGYSIVTDDDGRVMTNANTAKPGTSIDVRLAHGGLSATVDESHPTTDGGPETPRQLARQPS